MSLLEAFLPYIIVFVGFVATICLGLLASHFINKWHNRSNPNLSHSSKGAGNGAVQSLRQNIK